MKRIYATPHDFVRRMHDDRHRLKFDLSSTPMSFRPRAGWLVDSPGVDQHLFYFCMSGSILVRVRHILLSLRQGDGVWVSPDVPYRLESGSPDRTSVTRFRMTLHAAGSGRVALKTDFVISRNPLSIPSWVEVVRQESCVVTPVASHALRCALGGLLVSAFVSRADVPLEKSGERRLSLLQIRALLEWLQSLPPDARPSSAELAVRLKLSRDYTNELCRATFGISAERWLIQQRIHAAAQRLAESALNVSEVAQEYGYSSLFFFSRQFRSVLGLSPREWLSRIHSQPES